MVLFVQQKDPSFQLCEVRKAPKVYSSAVMQGMASFGILVTLGVYPKRVLRFWRQERKTGKSVAAVFKSIYLNAHILKARLDWLHFGFATMALGREQVGHAIGAKVAVSFRGFDLNVYPLKHSQCYDLLWKNLNKVHSISMYLLKEAQELGLSEKIPSSIITPAVDLAKLPTVKPPVAKQKVFLLTIARLHWIKGLDLALQAMALLKNNGIPFEYHIIGTGEQKQKERLQFMALELGISDTVIFHGKCSHQETLGFLGKTEIYIQPSLNEGFCNAVLEAQAMGISTLASNVGGLPENIKEGETGWLFECGNPDDLARKLNTILNCTAEEKKQISMAAIKRVRQYFSIEDQQEKFISFYKN